MLPLLPVQLKMPEHQPAPLAKFTHLNKLKTNGKIDTRSTEDKQKHIAPHYPVCTLHKFQHDFSLSFLIYCEIMHPDSQYTGYNLFRQSRTLHKNKSRYTISPPKSRTSAFKPCPFAWEIDSPPIPREELRYTFGAHFLRLSRES